MKLTNGMRRDSSRLATRTRYAVVSVLQKACAGHLQGGHATENASRWTELAKHHGQGGSASSFSVALMLKKGLQQPKLAYTHDPNPKHL
jgi:hypothetical protein